MFVVVVMLITRGGKQRALELELELSGRAGLEVTSPLDSATWNVGHESASGEPSARCLKESHLPYFALFFIETHFDMCAAGLVRLNSEAQGQPTAILTQSSVGATTKHPLARLDDVALPCLPDTGTLEQVPCTESLGSPLLLSCTH